MPKSGIFRRTGTGNFIKKLVYRADNVSQTAMYLP